MNPWDNYTSGQDWWKQQTANYSPQDAEDLYNMTFRGGRDTGQFKNGQPIYSPYFSQWQSRLNYGSNPDIYYGMLAAQYQPQEALNRWNSYNTTPYQQKDSGLSLGDRISTTRGW